MVSRSTTDCTSSNTACIGGAPRHDVLEGEAFLVAPDGQAARGLELLELDGTADDQEQLGHLERLDQVVLRARAG